MNRRDRISIVISPATLVAVLLLAPVAGHGQAPTDEQAKAAAAAKAQAARARGIAEQFEANARVLTVFDRQGKLVSTVGERAFYNNRQQVFSPDRTRLAVIKRDLESQTQGLWVLDVATGNSTLITSHGFGQTETALLRDGFCTPMTVDSSHLSTRLWRGHRQSV